MSFFRLSKAAGKNICGMLHKCQCFGHVKKLFMVVFNVFIQNNHIIITTIDQILGVKHCNRFSLFPCNRLSLKSGISLSHIVIVVSPTYKRTSLFVSLVTLKAWIGELYTFVQLNTESVKHNMCKNRIIIPDQQ